jgi:hypothetical protein
MTDQVSMRYGEHGQIRMVFGDVHLQPGMASHCLVVSMKATATWLDAESSSDHAQALLTGTVLMEQPGYKWLAAMHPQVLSLRGFMTSDSISIELSDDQLIALDRASGDGGIALRCKLKTTLMHPPAEVYPVTEEEVTVRIPRTRWVELLDQAGAEVGIVIRLAMPVQDPAASSAPTTEEEHGSLTRATTRLAEARSQLRDHQWEQCVVTCRRVLEHIPRLAQLPTAASFSDVSPRKRSPEQRWAAIYWDAWSLTNASHHDDSNTADFLWSRADAEAVLVATAGLLKRYTST